MLQHTYIILYNCHAWRSYISWLHRSYYSPNIYQKQINSMKIKNWFQPQLIFHSFIIHYQDRERHSVKHTTWLFINLCFLVYIFIILYHTSVHYHWDRGGSALCTYVPSCVLYNMCSLYVLWLAPLFVLCHAHVTIFYGRSSSTAPSTFFSV